MATAKDPSLGEVMDYSQMEFKVDQINIGGTVLDEDNVGAFTGAGTATLVSNAATITDYATQVTSEALTTAAGASQAFVLTFTGLTTADLAFVQYAGGTNTRRNLKFMAVVTANTVTVTMYNTEPTNAVNGTVIFNVLVVKAD